MNLKASIDDGNEKSSGKPTTSKTSDTAPSASPPLEPGVNAEPDRKKSTNGRIFRLKTSGKKIQKLIGLCQVCGNQVKQSYSKEPRTCSLSCARSERVTIDPIGAFYSLTKRINECVVWIGKKNADGYGILRRSKKELTAHRYVWELEIGEVSEGLCVLHKCDNRCCVKIEHLFLGTQVDNVRDMDSKGRRATSRH